MDLARAYRYAGSGLFAGGLGGLASVLAQDFRLTDARSVFAGSPSPAVILLAASIMVVSVLSGYILGVAGRTVSSVLLIFLTVIALNALLLGATYFSSGISLLASILPLSILVVLGRDQLAAPQFTSHLSADAAMISAGCWGLIIGIVAVVRMVRRVE